MIKVKVQPSMQMMIAMKTREIQSCQLVGIPIMWPLFLKPLKFKVSLINNRIPLSILIRIRSIPQKLTSRNPMQLKIRIMPSGRRKRELAIRNWRNLIILSLEPPRLKKVRQSLLRSRRSR